MTGFGEIDKKIGPKWATFDSFGANWGKQDFWEKSENVISVRLLCCNFVQETRINL